MSTRNGKNYEQRETMAATIWMGGFNAIIMQELETRREETAQHKLEFAEREQARRLELEGLSMKMGGGGGGGGN